MRSKSLVMIESNKVYVRGTSCSSELCINMYYDKQPSSPAMLANRRLFFHHIDVTSVSNADRIAEAHGCLRRETDVTRSRV